MSRTEAPFRVEFHEYRGRYLVATKDLKQGDIIFQERPLVVGPSGVGYEKSKVFSTCLGCYKNVTTLYKCKKCGWPVCNAVCEMSPDHADFECMVFADCPVSPITNPRDYEKIKVLRCLMLKEKNPDGWKAIRALQSHEKSRKQDVYAVSRDIACYKFIRDECHLKQFPFEDINHVTGVCAINSYTTKGHIGQTVEGEGHRYASFLFYYASLISHDCIPNTRTVIQQRGRSFLMNTTAAIDIREGDILTTSYIDPNFGTVERRKFLMDHFYFSCKCVRCQDPTELGSYVSAMKCTNTTCKNGWLLPEDSLDPASEWVCSQLAVDCDNVVPASIVNGVIQNVHANMRAVHKIQELNQLLSKYKGSILHKNHYLIVNLECAILRMLEDAVQKTKDHKELFRLAEWQVELCRHCLHVADLVQPGRNRFRGNLLYILQDALLTICTIRLSECSEPQTLGIVRKRCKKQFVEALEIMKEAKSIMIEEPVGSRDWHKGQMLSLEACRIKSLMSYLSFKD